MLFFGIFLYIIESRPDNITFELNQVFSSLEKLIVFTEKEKLNILTKKDTGNILMMDFNLNSISLAEHQEVGAKPDPLTDKELETVIAINLAFDGFRCRKSIVQKLQSKRKISMK